MSAWRRVTPLGKQDRESLLGEMMIVRQDFPHHSGRFGVP